MIKFFFSQSQRLSKYLANTGVCSRREAEKLIQNGLIRVDGKKIDENIPVTSQNKIQVFTNQGERMPIKEDTRVWVFYKPVGMICSHNDPFKRPSFYDYAKQLLKVSHLISVGRLDFNSEGLIILTNNGDLARVMELPASRIEREYRVRIYGYFDENKLIQIRKGVTINGIKYGPFWVSVDTRQSRNTWLIMRLETGKNREIRRVMRKFSLRVNRIVRLKYGPYTLNGLKPGGYYEAKVEPEVKRKMYLNLRQTYKEKTQQIGEEKVQRPQLQSPKQQRKLTNNVLQ